MNKLNTTRGSWVLAASVAWCVAGLCLIANAAMASETAREVVVRPLSAGGRPASGHISRTRIQLQQRAVADDDWMEGTLRLAISENLPSGAGDLLRGSAWMAAFAAARNVQEPLFGHSFLIDVQGMLDGPSAGALYAVGMLATLRGDTLFPDATMTGALMPDGGIGLVGGIRHKLDAAKKGGMTKVVLPESQRIDIDEEGALLDVTEYADKIGISVVFAGSLEDAYYEMTGKLLTRPGITPRGNVSLPSEMMSTIRSRARERFELLGPALVAFRENPGFNVLERRERTVRAAVIDVVATEFGHLEETFARGLALMQEGEWVAAYDMLAGALLKAQALIAWRDDQYPVHSRDAIQKMVDADLNRVFEMRTAVPETRGLSKVDAGLLQARIMRDALDMQTPLRLADSINLLVDARHAELAGQHRTLWQDLFGTGEEREFMAQRREVLAQQTFMAYSYRTARAVLEQSEPATVWMDPDFFASALVFRDTGRPARTIQAKRAAQWAVFSKNSFKAVHDAFTTALAEYGDDALYYYLFDPDVRRAGALVEFLEEMDDQEPAPAGDATPTSAEFDAFIQALIFSQEEIEMSAFLVRNQLGQLGGDSDRSPLLRSGSLRRMLDRAAANARHAILTARHGGHHVISPSYDYLLAEGLRTGNANDQFKALRLYWSAAAQCQLVALCTQP